MGKLWLNNELVDRLAMLQQALKYVNYDLHAPASINFLIPEHSMESWKVDYSDMRRFFIYGQSLEFDELMQKISELQKRVRDMAK